MFLIRVQGLGFRVFTQSKDVKFLGNPAVMIYDAQLYFVIAS